MNRNAATMISVGVTTEIGFKTGLFVVAETVLGLIGHSQF